MLRGEWELGRKGDGLGTKWWEADLLRKRREVLKRMGKITAFSDAPQLDLHCCVILKLHTRSMSLAVVASLH